jgi:CBS domain-containing protein
MKVAEIMNRRPVTVTPSTTLRDVALLMIRFHLNDLLVVGEGNKILGIVTFKDLFSRLLPDYSEVMDEATWTNPEAIEERLIDVVKLPASAVMTTNLHTATPDTYVVRAGSMMNAYRVKQLPVVEGGNLVGVVSYTDITWGLLLKYYKHL